MKYEERHKAALIGYGWKSFSDNAIPELDTPVWVLGSRPENPNEMMMGILVRRKERGWQGFFMEIFDHPGVLLKFWHPLARPALPYTMEHTDP